MDNLPEDFFTTSFQFTENIYRDVYPSIDPKTTPLSQAGKVIVITGASGGISRAGIVPAFAKANAKAIVLVSRNSSALDATKEEISKINPKVQLLSVPTNITNEDSVKALFKQIEQSFGSADVLVNNAGVLGAENVSLKDGEFSDWWSNFDVNVKGTALMCKYFLQILGMNKAATIVNLTAGLAFMVRPGVSAYSISKLAAYQMVPFIAAENPRVTAVGLHPGIVKTRLVSGEMSRFAKDTPALVGGLAVWLATDAARFLSGRFVASNWSVDDLMARAQEIQSEDLLKVRLNAELGLQQFSK